MFLLLFLVEFAASTTTALSGVYARPSDINDLLMSPAKSPRGSASQAAAMGAPPRAYPLANAHELLNPTSPGAGGGAGLPGAAAGASAPAHVAGVPGLVLSPLPPSQPVPPSLLSPPLMTPQPQPPPASPAVLAASAPAAPNSLDKLLAQQDLLMAQYTDETDVARLAVLERKMEWCQKQIDQQQQRMRDTITPAAITPASTSGAMLLPPTAASADLARSASPGKYSPLPALQPKQ